MADGSTSAAAPNAQQTAFVYVMGSAVGPQKVGMTADPEARLRVLQTGHPYRLALSYTVKVSVEDARNIERRAHAVLKGRALVGEWFKVTPAEARAAVEAACTSVSTDLVSTRPLLRRRYPDGLSYLVATGAITLTQQAAGLRYRKLWRAVSEALDQQGVVMRAQEVGARETIVGRRQQLDALHAAVRAGTSAETVAVLTRIAGEGYALRRLKLTKDRKPRIVGLLRLALDIVDQRL